MSEDEGILSVKKSLALADVGFAASRNKKSEEERSPERREEAEKRLSRP